VNATSVPSDSQPGSYHNVTRDACTCKAFEFGHARNPQFRCKHQLRAFPAPRLCEYCHVDIARQSSCYCSDRCRVASLRASCRHAWTEAGSAEFACTKCGAVYSYADDEPLLVSQARPSFYDSCACPGYLKRHAAHGDTLESYWCPACDPEAEADPVHRRQLAVGRRAQQLRDAATLEGEWF